MHSLILLGNFKQTFIHLTLNLLYTYFNRKQIINVNPQGLEIPMLIGEKRKIKNYPPLSL
jgi:hypothetical protein